MVVLLASLVASLGLVAQVGGTKLIHRVQHDRCLANIARLELSLGLREPSSQETFARMTAARYALSLNQLAQAKASNYVSKPSDDMARQIRAQREESVRIAETAMGRRR